ncbi:MAG: iron-sulfur cluster assembly accessory protein [Gammaproteobacteria bacterium]|nr:iron-sulfur cluster assembly accessory protein [Gammaproteobacteria bacterium]MDQ7074929.1 iron-sulfur cluster assembly accessory protein [Gammaproteobacteria bacterium]
MNAFNSTISNEIAISPSAHQQLLGLVQQEDDVLGLRIFVSGGGCGGMGYSMTFATEQYDHDAVLKQDDLNVYVDSVALQFLNGVEIDYQERSMGGGSFVFKNVFKAVGGSGGCNACGSAGGSGGGCG